jgi:hypothetical protein
MEMEISLESQIDFPLWKVLKTWHRNFRKFTALIFQKTALCTLCLYTLCYAETIQSAVEFYGKLKWCDPKI